MATDVDRALCEVGFLLVVTETLPTAAARPSRCEPVTAGQFRRSRVDSITVG